MKFLFALLLTTLSSGAFAQQDDERRLIYCDHKQGLKLYMDIYLRYNPKENVYTDPEVAFFDSFDKAIYPNYLWPVSVIFDPSSNQNVLIIDKGNQNRVQFRIPAIDTGIVLEKNNKMIQPFNITAQGIYKGHDFADQPFSCYNVLVPL